MRVARAALPVLVVCVASLATLAVASNPPLEQLTHSWSSYRCQPNRTGSLLLADGVSHTYNAADVLSIPGGGSVSGDIAMGVDGHAVLTTTNGYVMKVSLLTGTVASSNQVAAGVSLSPPVLRKTPDSDAIIFATQSGNLYELFYSTFGMVANGTILSSASAYFSPSASSLSTVLTTGSHLYVFSDETTVDSYGEGSITFLTPPTVYDAEMWAVARTAGTLYRLLAYSNIGLVTKDILLGFGSDPPCGFTFVNNGVLVCAPAGYVFVNSTFHVNGPFEITTTLSHEPVVLDTTHSAAVFRTASGSYEVRAFLNDGSGTPSQATLTGTPSGPMAFVTTTQVLFIPMSDGKVLTVSVSGGALSGAATTYYEDTSTASLSSLAVVYNPLGSTYAMAASTGTGVKLIGTICPAGYSSGDGRRPCTACAAGKVNNAKGSTACTDCDPGTFATAGSTTCSLCPAGTYQENAAQGVCTDCPVNTYSSRIGSVTVDTCILCPYPQRCLAGNRCSAGYAGELCGQCASGYYRIGVDCFPCPSSQIPWESIMVGLFIVGLVFLLLRVSVNSIVITMVKMFVNTLQTLVISISIDLAWPSVLKDVIARLDVINLDLGRVAGPECYWTNIDFTFYVRYGLMLTGILVIYAILIAARLYVLRAMRVQLSGGDESKYNQGRDRELLTRAIKIQRIMLIVLMIVYFPLTQYSFNIFMCRPSDTGAEVLNVDTGIECFTSTHVVFMIIAGAVLLLFSIGLPVWLYFFLRKQYMLGQLTAKRAKYGALYEVYREKYVWWESLVMFRKLLLVSINFVSEVVRPRVTDSRQDLVVQVQTCFAAGVVVLYTVVTSLALPYQHRFFEHRGRRVDINNAMEIVSNSVSDLVILTGLFIAFSAFEDDSAAGLGVGISCIVLLAVFVALVVYVVMRHAGNVFHREYNYDELKNRIDEARDSRDYLTAANLQAEYKAAKADERMALARDLEKAEAFQREDEVAQVRARLKRMDTRADLGGTTDADVRKDVGDVLREAAQYRRSEAYVVTCAHRGFVSDAKDLLGELETARAQLKQRMASCESRCVALDMFAEAYKVKVAAERSHIDGDPQRNAASNSISRTRSWRRSFTLSRGVSTNVESLHAYIERSLGRRGGKERARKRCGEAMAEALRRGDVNNAASILMAMETAHIGKKRRRKDGVRDRVRRALQGDPSADADQGDDRLDALADLADEVEEDYESDSDDEKSAAHKRDAGDIELQRGSLSDSPPATVTLNDFSVRSTSAGDATDSPRVSVGDRGTLLGRSVTQDSDR